MSNNKFADCNEEKCKKREECSNKGKVEAPLNYGKKERDWCIQKTKFVIMVNLYLKNIF